MPFHRSGHRLKKTFLLVDVGERSSISHLSLLPYALHHLSRLCKRMSIIIIELSSNEWFISLSGLMPNASANIQNVLNQATFRYFFFIKPTSCRHFGYRKTIFRTPEEAFTARSAPTRTKKTFHILSGCGGRNKTTAAGISGPMPASAKRLPLPSTGKPPSAGPKSFTRMQAQIHKLAGIRQFSFTFLTKNRPIHISFTATSDRLPSPAE